VSNAQTHALAMSQRGHHADRRYLCERPPRLPAGLTIQPLEDRLIHIVTVTPWKPAVARVRPRPCPQPRPYVEEDLEAVVRFANGNAALETRGGRQVGNAASGMILRAVNLTTSQVVFCLAGPSVAGTTAAANYRLRGSVALIRRSQCLIGGVALRLG
jgi:hypothetical protein